MKYRDNSYVLWLPSWYPSKIEPYNGDFIKRHAAATALYTDVHILYVIRDASGTITKDFLKEIVTTGRLKETIIYYYVSPCKIKWLEKFNSFIKYNELYKQTVKEIFSNEGKPYLVHAYIAFKAGLIALWIKKKFKIPFVLSEQWTAYLSGAMPNLSDLPFFSKRRIKTILENAESVMVVSKYLGESLKAKYKIPIPVVIPNVVDVNLFTYVPQTLNAVCRFIHISNLGYQKNPDALINAFSMVKAQGYDFYLDIIGPERNDLIDLTKMLGLQDVISFHNEMQQSDLAYWIRKADALILYSRYETFGCVIIEANACGVPVIVSDMPVMHENVIEGFNGIFAANENEKALSEAIISFIKNRHLFKKEKIAERAASKFNYDFVGLQINSWYGSNKK